MKIDQWVRFGVAAVMLVACVTRSAFSDELPTMTDHKQQVVELLKSIETGDSKPLAYINPDKYIQHNLAVGDGLAGVMTLFQSLPKGSAESIPCACFKTAISFLLILITISSARKSVLTSSALKMGRSSSIGTTCRKPPPSRVQAVTRWWMARPIASDIEKTEANKALMQAYMDDLLHGRRDKFSSYFDGNNYIQHNPWVGDGLTGLVAGLQALAKQGLAVKYQQVHQVLGEGNFVLVVSAGSFGERPMSYYDLYRIQNGKIAEHWDTLETIPPRGEWKNPNGKF